MNQKINPSYNAKMNANTEAITIVRHVPALPPASGIYKYDLLYCKDDCCFYHEIQTDVGSWIWEKVTYGINRQYVVPVGLLFGTTYTFDDIVNRLSKIIEWIDDRYDETIEPLPTTSILGTTEEACISKYNELASYLNNLCHASLPIFPSDHSAAGTEAKTFGDNYVNELIRFLNPYANEMVLVDVLCGLSETAAPEENLKQVIEIARQIKAKREEI